MRIRTIGVGLLLIAGSAVAADRHEGTLKVTRIAKRAVTPGAVANAAASAAWNQLRDSPEEWGSGAPGFGKRVASAIGKHAIKIGIQYPVAYLRHEELRYRPSGKQGFRPRLQYALLSTVITRKTTTGKSTVFTSEISGAFGSGFLSMLWQPASLRSVSHGFFSGGITLGMDAAGHVVREFWPEIRHPRRRRSEPTEAGLQTTAGMADGVNE